MPDKAKDNEGVAGPGGTVPPAEPVGKVAPEVVPPPAQDAEALRAELAEHKQRQTGWDRTMGRMLERQGKMEQRLDQMLGLMSQGDASPALLKRFQNLELELAQTKDLIQAQQGTSSSEEGAVLSYEQKLLQERKAEEAAANAKWDERVAATREAIEDDLQEAGLPLTAVTSDAQFMSLWSGGKLREARQRAKQFVTSSVAKPPSHPPATSETSAEEEETEPQRVERLVSERLRAELGKRGLLLNDRGGGGGQNWEEVRAAYINNPRDPQVKQRYLQMRGESRRT